MTHERRVDRLNPALILILVDQSESMDEGIAGGPTPKSTAVAEQINNLIYELVLRCVKNPREAPRPYFFVDVIGYSTDGSGHVVLRRELGESAADPYGLMSTTELAERPLRIAQVAGNGETLVNRPVWVEPFARGGTPMCAALDAAGRTAANWIQRYPDAFPPIILNLSDGFATDGDPEVWTRRIRSLATSDGNALLFNINLSTSAAAPVLFPPAAEGRLNQYAARMFGWSSELPEAMLESARSQGIPVERGARAFAYNADVRALAQFLSVGTSIGRAL
ncbi:hypothetical protein [Nocardioides sp. MH1]|uniref:hypothetical protein n=1 Tax=Nocardioides sp. MH1 TaxID=3242490 RepID=UPI003522A009